MSESSSSQIKLGARPIEVVDKIPTPEEVFKLPKIGWKEIFLVLMGPAFIATGDAFGSGEWLMIPAFTVRYGWGMAWAIWLLVLCQAVYQIMWARLIVVFGEIPAIFFSRLPGGPKFWSWFVAINHAARVAWPGWAMGAATAAAAMILGRIPGAADAPFVRGVAAALFFLVLLTLLFGGKVERILEAVEKALTLFIVFALLFIVLPLTIKAEVLKEFAVGLVSIGYIPHGVDILLLGGFVGYVGSAMAHNWYNVVYYRDKGYGMGSAVGYIPSAIGGVKVFVSPIGKFPKPTPENIATVKKWMRIVTLDQMLIYFTICTFAGTVPALIATSLLPRGTVLGGWGIAAHVSEAFAKVVGPWGFYLISFIGLSILFTTQLMLSDNLSRNIIEIFWSTSEGVRKWAKGDIRRLYYTLLVVYIIFAVIIIWSGMEPLLVLLISANVPHFMAFWSIPALIYINEKLLPKEYRSPRWMYIFLAIMFVFSAVIFVGLVLYYGFGIKIF
jgi:Mn2+/Fe2+ NRAMP family transporter